MGDGNLDDHETYIRIVGLPNGEMPEFVRRAWVGLMLPCYFWKNNVFGRGVTARDQKVFKGKVYVVPQVQALGVLGATRPEVVRWWLSQGYPLSDTATFLFGENCVEECSRIPSFEEMLAMLERLRDSN